MSTGTARALSALAMAGLALGGGCSQDKLRTQSAIKVSIAAPLDGAVVYLTDTVDLAAVASDAPGVARLTLFAGKGVVATCLPPTAGTVGTELACEGTFKPADHAADLVDGKLVLTASATSAQGETGQVQVSILAKAALSTVIIDSPSDGASVGSTDAVLFQAHALNAQGLNTLKLTAGSDALATCAASPASATRIDCQFTTTLQDHASQLVNGALALTATSLDTQGNTVSAQVLLHAGPVGLAFVDPPITQPVPPVAVVSGTSALTLRVTGVVTGVLVTEGLNIVATLGTGPFSKSINWAKTLGVGQHTLNAVATDAQGNEATARRTVQVNCSADAECASGTRCCPGDGQCHPIVADGAACDCAHPCPFTQGCFPGTCGGPPQICRPGCFPGSDSPERMPDTCANINGVAAYCNPLPPNEATPQNHGGACAPGDGCDVTRQNCPDLPLDRTRPAGPQNPAVKQTCEPAGGNATACFPAGSHPLQDTNPGNNCLDGVAACGSATSACTQGLLCVGIVDNPGAGHACDAQCNDPVDPSNYPFSSPPQAPDCPPNHFCNLLYGTGLQVLPTGACFPR